MKKQAVKKLKTVTAKKPKAAAVKKVLKGLPVKLSKSDPNYYAKIGAISAAKRKLKSDYFSNMAKLSHNAESRPEGYKGGRKKKDAI